MNYKLNFIIVLLFTCIYSNSPEFSICSKTITGGSFFEYPSSAIKLHDGGCAAIGSSRSFSYDGNRQAIYFILYDKEGDTVLTRHFGGEYRETMIPAMDEGLSLIESEDRTFLLAGLYKTNSSIAKLWLIKLNKNGDSLWSSIINENISVYHPLLIQGTSEKGYLIAYSGNRGSDLKYDIRLLLIDSTGILKKSSSQGIILGTPQTPYGYDQIALKLERNGDETFTIVASNVSERGALPKLWVFRTDTSLNIISNYFGELISDDHIIRAYDRGFYSCFKVPANTGFVSTSTADRNVIAKSDSLGYIQWYKQYYSSSPLYFNVLDIIQSSDSSIWIVGDKILHLSKDGDSIGLYPYAAHINDLVMDAISANDSTAYFLSRIQSANSALDFCLLKLSTNCGITNALLPVSLQKNSPISIANYNLLGQTFHSISGNSYHGVYISSGKKDVKMLNLRNEDLPGKAK